MYDTEIQKLTGFNRIYQADCFPDEESAVLLTAFKEKDVADYQSAITRAEHIIAELESE